MRDGRAGAAIAGMMIAIGVCYPAASVTYVETAGRLELGEADGIAVSSRGALFMTPRLVRLGDASMPGQPDHVWSSASDSAGNLYLGTGPEGQVIRITDSGQKTVFFSADDPMVTALAFDADGTLIAGTSPGGKLYRIPPDGRGELWGETGERYVWKLVRTADGRLFAATGERGMVVRIGSNGEADPFFDSDEAHIVSLLPDADGGLYAGGAGRGIVYQIDDEGNGIVLFDDSLAEVTGLAIDTRKRLWIGLIAPPDRETAPPELSLRLPDGVEVGRTGESLGNLTESSGPTLRGVIEGLTKRERVAAAGARGRLVRLDDEGRAEVMWESTEQALFCVTTMGERVYFGTGEPARLYEIDGRDDVARIATLDEGQTTELWKTGRSLALATSNPGRLYRLDRATRESALFVSAPLDAGAPARWGAIRWQLGDSNGAAGRVEIYTRTGNSRDPDSTWSGWSPAMTDPARSRVVNPDGRYLQWRARFVAPGNPDHRLSGVTVHYAPYNRTPAVRGFGLEGDDRWVSDSATFVWSSRDPDGDPVTLELAYRSPGTQDWSVAGSAEAARDPGAGGWSDGKLVWDTSTIAEGFYEIRALATDQIANDSGKAGRVALDLPVLLVVDRTPPTYELRPTGDRRLGLTLADTYSEIRRLEVVRDGRPVYLVGPTDGVYDSTTEAFELELPETASGQSLRGQDAAGNQVEIPLKR